MTLKPLQLVSKGNGIIYILEVTDKYGSPLLMASYKHKIHHKYANVEKTVLKRVMAYAASRGYVVTHDYGLYRDDSLKVELENALTLTEWECVSLFSYGYRRLRQ